MKPDCVHYKKDGECEICMSTWTPKDLEKAVKDNQAAFGNIWGDLPKYSDYLSEEELKEIELFWAKEEERLIGRQIFDAAMEFPGQEEWDSLCSKFREARKKVDELEVKNEKQNK